MLDNDMKSSDSYAALSRSMEGYVDGSDAAIDIM